MSCIITSSGDYLLPDEREQAYKSEHILVLSPYKVQAICFDLLRNYLTLNYQKDLGYAFSQRFSTDPVQSEIGLEMSYSFKDAIVQKRPGIYVSRGAAEFMHPTMGQLTGINVPESERTSMSIIQLPIKVTVLATNVGFAEELAEYVFRIFLTHRQQIQNDYKLRAFKLQGIEPPVLAGESKDHFAVGVNLLAAFDMSQVVKRDDLKLKTYAMTVFTDRSRIPITGQ